jgi:hypothetical protein
MAAAFRGPRVEPKGFWLLISKWQSWRAQHELKVEQRTLRKLFLKIVTPSVLLVEINLDCLITFVSRGLTQVVKRKLP